jgi:formate dehydrogenase gamma subunit
MTSPAKAAAGSRPARATDTKGSAYLTRFDLVERGVHWANAILFLGLIFTGAALYFTPLMGLIGRRELVERIHVYMGLALPVPLLLALWGSWGTALRADLRRFNRWTTADGAWLRLSTRGRPIRQRYRAKLAIGKFNAGQKLNAAFTAGGGLVMLGTGIILRWYRPWPLTWREGATFVHNWLALLFVVVIIGHILMALSDQDSLRSMMGGRIRRRWAQHHAPAWLAEIDAADALLAGAGPTEAVSVGGPTGGRRVGAGSAGVGSADVGSADVGSTPGVGGPAPYGAATKADQGEGNSADTPEVVLPDVGAPGMGSPGTRT